MLPERIETVIVGGGQAGLAMSHHLGRLGREHVILERRRVAERWRSERWDSLCFQAPNWNMRLPGMDRDGADPDAFSTRDEVVAFLERYAGSIDAPIRCGVTAKRLRQKSGSSRLLVESSAGCFDTRNVVIATGPFQVPAANPVLCRKTLHLHSSQYRNPELLPPGAVLVVGAGNSGCQIAEDLRSADRRVYLSVSRHQRTPRRYRGKDCIWWNLALGDADRTLEQRVSVQPSRLMTGVGGGYDLDLRRLAADGVVLLGRLLGGADGKITLAPDLCANLAQGDASLLALLRRCDDYIDRNGLDFAASDMPAALPDPREVCDPILTLDLNAAGISTIIWANGFRYDFDWIELPIFADCTTSSGRVPRHARGVTSVPGAYFLGLPWLHKWKSAFLFGVGEDAEYLAGHIAARRQS